MSGLVYDTFYVANAGDKKILYYSASDNGLSSSALDLSTEEATPSDYPIFPEGEPFEYNGGVSIYQNASPTMTNLIPSVDYTSLGLDSAIDYYYTIHDIEACENWVYYRLEANLSAPEVCIGWRDGYRRIKTQIIREELGGGKKEILFEY